MSTYILEVNSAQLAYIRQSLETAPAANDPASASLKHMLDPELSNKSIRLEPAPVMNCLHL